MHLYNHWSNYFHAYFNTCLDIQNDMAMVVFPKNIVEKRDKANLGML